jgi:hypothetical protein
MGKWSMTVSRPLGSHDLASSHVLSIKISLGDKVYNPEYLHVFLLGVGGRLTVTFLVAEESPLSL